MIAIIVAAVALMFPALIVPVLVTAIVPAVTMTFLVARNILAVVPVVLHKEDALAAGVIFAAVLAPVFGMARGDAQIDWWAVHRYPLDCYRLTMDHLWLWKAADVDPAIEAGLADADRDANVGSEGRDGDHGNGYYRCDQKTFHVESPVVSGS
jgi:hypothetical protein